MLKSLNLVIIIMTIVVTRALATECHGVCLSDNKNKICRNLKYESLVLEGGGLKGLAYVGAMRALAEHGYYTNDIWQFKNISGTSVGCLFGYFLALDISHEHLETMALGTNFTHLFHKDVRSILDVPRRNRRHDDSIIDKISYFWNLLKYVRRVIGVWYHNDAPGVSNGSEITDWIMSSVLKYSPYKHLINRDTTFAEFEDITQHSLTCYATKISSDTTLMELNARTAPRQKILNVLYSSMTLPLLFKPLTDKLGDTLVDGGLILNFPIYQQDWNDRKNNKVLGLSLHKQPQTNGPTLDQSKSFDFFADIDQYSTISTLNYLQKIIRIVTSIKSYILYSNDPRNCDRVVYLDSRDISMIDLKLTSDKISKSIRTAYVQTMHFLKPSDKSASLTCLNRTRLYALRHSPQHHE